jgi:hypothetical protein
MDVGIDFRAQTVSRLGRIVNRRGLGLGRRVGSARLEQGQTPMGFWLHREGTLNCR